MKTMWSGMRLVGGAAVVLAMAGWAAAAMAADTFTAPTKEELEMKSLPGYPGAAAVVLFQEVVTRDDMHSQLHYERIKILTEEGKKYANVELSQGTSRGGDVFDPNMEVTADTIQGRTIHADGTIIPFTGKPYLKTVEDTKQYKLQKKVFTLPDVEVGSIIEYRYAIRNTDTYYVSPDWFLQGDLFVRKAHYAWYPTSHELGSEDGMVNAIHWFPILRAQDKLEQKMAGTGKCFELVTTDIPPAPNEEFMPPVKNFTYRVLFTYTPFRTTDEFWSDRGKKWSKGMNGFAGPNGKLRDETAKVTAGATTDEDKLRKIYATVMSLENTAYTRERDKREDKANGEKTDNAYDVLMRKRGNPTQLTMLFIGMARAAGMQANAMLVPDRSIEIVAKGYESMSQFDDTIAVVNVGGKDAFFDPGSRYVPFGRLAWQHTEVMGLRQVDNAATWGTTPLEAYTANSMFRVANLKMDEHGQVSGTVNMTYNGARAVHWRQEGLRGDRESLNKDLEDSLAEMLPKTMTVKVASVDGLDDYEKPLVVKFDATGSIGSMSGKRMMVPADLFNAGATAAFPHEARELPVYFHYPENVRDALRINLPPTLQPEAVPDSAKYSLPQTAGYGMQIQSAPTGFTTRRDFATNAVIVEQKDYADLRKFYSQFEAKDQESVVLKQVAAASPGSESAAK